MIRVALLGNPNVGKSSLFNSLTGQKQKVANWPGKTIECKKGICKVGGDDIEIFDLPGTYSLSPFSDDEKIVDETLKSVDFDVIIQIADSSNIERNLYLTLELLERTRKVVVALNMDDIATKEGMKIDEKKLSKIFGIDFVKIDARKKNTLGNLLLHAINVAKHPKSKSEALQSPKARYKLIQKAVQESVSCKSKINENWFDKIALNQYLGPILFLLIMFSVFHLTFILSEPLSVLVDFVWGLPTSYFVEIIESIDSLPNWIVSLLEDGIIAGVGSIISFFPPIAVMMFLLYFLEDSGYLARAVVVLDSLLKKFGLGGKAFIPLLLGTGCNVPAIMATRIIKDTKTKLITIFSIPFMSCSARLPVYVLFAGVFFPNNEANIIFFMYILGFVVAILNALLLKTFVFKKEDEELLIELPKYHWPYLKNLFIETKMSVEHFARRAGTVILIASVAIWFLSSAPYGVDYGSKESVAGIIGSTIAPLFSPLGFDSWQSGLALFNGMVAKEIVISSFATTYGVGEEAELSSLILQDFSTPSALAFMVFVLLYVPCFAAMGTIKSETKSWKMTILSAIYYIVVAYGISFLIYSLALNFWGDFNGL
ncbi:MAG: ferrous iron transport protein B [Candidatus Micrarchaeota archaeon]